MENSKQKLLVIVGPTATGKSALGVRLAQTFHTDVISGDAYQIYTGMNIGTAKITPAEMAGVVHHLIDVVSPDQSYSVAKFQAAAQANIAAMTAANKLPVIVGGTGFYVNSLVQNLPLGGSVAAGPGRQYWQDQLTQHDPQWLWQQLAIRDEKAADKIPPANVRRVIRALEVISQTGQKFSEQPQTASPYEALIIGLTTERALLYARIDQRVDAMIAAGLVEEVAHIRAIAGDDAQAMQAIGYKELLPYLDGQAALQTCVAAIKQHSRRFAKRQLTYFRNQMPTHWFDLIQHPESLTMIVHLVDAWLKGETDELEN